MTFQQKFFIVVLMSTAAALGLAMRLPPARHEQRSRPLERFGVLVSLASMIVSLLVVGVVSQTFRRHVIQIGPLVVALGIGALWPRFRAAAALPLFAFWLFMMGGIWLFLLGIAPVFTGRFSPTEVILTILIGIASVIGLIGVVREGMALRIPARLATFLCFAVLQPVALILSFGRS